MNNRRDFLVALGGWLAPGGRREPDHIAFEQRLRELGFVEGRNLVIEFRTTEGREAPGDPERAVAEGEENRRVLEYGHRGLARMK